MAQGTAYRSVIKNAAYIFLIKLFPAIAFLSITILYSRALSKEDYGDYQSFWVKWLLLGTVAYAGLPVTIITYSASVIRQFALRLGLRHVVGYLTWLSVWAGVFAYLVWSELSIVLWLGIGLLVMYVVHAVQESLLMAAKNMKGVVLVNFLYGLYFLFIHINALAYYDLSQLLLYLLAGMLARGGLLSIIVYLSYRRQQPLAQDVSLADARNLWLHLGFYDLLQNVFRFVDKFILSILLSSGLYAVYFNGAQEIPILPYLLGAVSSSVLVQLASRAASEKYQSHHLMYESGRLLSCIVFPLFFFLFFFSREVFVVVFSEKYLSSVPIFMVMLLVLPLRAYNYTVLLQHFHRGALINKGALLDLLLAIALMYPLYYALGLPGIVLSFVLSTYIQVGYYLYHTSNITHVPVIELLPLRNWLVKLLVFGSFLYVLHYLLSDILSPRATLVMGAIWTIVIGATVFLVEWKRTSKQQVQ